MSNFPLFDMLYSQTKSKMPKASEKEECVININSLDSEGKKLLYAIIKTYKEYIEKIVDNTVPYSQEVKEKKNKANTQTITSITFNFNDFPNKLKNMIILFVEKHLEKIRSDTDRNEACNLAQESIKE